MFEYLCSSWEFENFFKWNLVFIYEIICLNKPLFSVRVGPMRVGSWWRSLLVLSAQWVDDRIPRTG